MHRKKKDELSEEERILREAKHKQAIVAAERNRVYFFRQRNNAAVTIQKAWKMYVSSLSIYTHFCNYVTYYFKYELYYKSHNKVIINYKASELLGWEIKGLPAR